MRQVRTYDAGELTERLRAGDGRAVARLISLVEDGAHEQLSEIADALNPDTGQAEVIGLTGSPGVGKSTLCDALVAAYRRAGRTVGVLAVDPSSPFTGGALLGDRVRMQRHALDEGVYIRSMATRGHLGGLAWATPQALRVLDAAGCDVVLVETVGVGQAEVEVASLADSTVVLLAPGMGDAIQAVKAGILEIADIFVVNKADREGADAAVRDLRGMLALGDRPRGQSVPAGVGRATRTVNGSTTPDGDGAPWRPPVLKTVAERGDGVAEVVAAIATHHSHLAASGELTARRERRAAAEIEHIAVGMVRARLGWTSSGPALPSLAADVAGGRTDPYTAASTLVDALPR